MARVLPIGLWPFTGSVGRKIGEIWSVGGRRGSGEMGDFGDEGSRGGEETGGLGEAEDIEGRRISLSGVSCWKIDDRLRPLPFC